MEVTLSSFVEAASAYAANLSCFLLFSLIAYSWINIWSLCSTCDNLIVVKNDLTTNKKIISKKIKFAGLIMPMELDANMAIWGKTLIITSANENPIQNIESPICNWDFLILRKTYNKVKYYKNLVIYILIYIIIN